MVLLLIEIIRPIVFDAVRGTEICYSPIKLDLTWVDSCIVVSIKVRFR